MEIQKEKPMKLKAYYTKHLELTLMNFPANLSDLEEQCSAWFWRQCVVIKIGREWASELRV